MEEAKPSPRWVPVTDQNSMTDQIPPDPRDIVAATIAAGYLFRDPGRPPSTTLNIWTCMVCGTQDRPYSAISVVQQPLAGMEEYGGVVNVAYCNDRPDCVAVALPNRPWTIAGPLHTSGGVALTDQVIESLAAEAEAGYPPDQLTPRVVTEPGTDRYKALARILSDLDRCPHGRHAGDTCSGYRPGEPMSGCEGGRSLGNPYMPGPGERAGTDLGGRPYRMPAHTESTGDPESWR